MINRKKYIILIGLFLFVAFGITLLILYNSVLEQVGIEHNVYSSRLEDYVNGNVSINSSEIDTFTAEEYVNDVRYISYTYPSVAALYDKSGKQIALSDVSDFILYDEFIRQQLIDRLIELEKATDSFKNFDSDIYNGEINFGGTINVRTGRITIDGEEYISVEADYMNSHSDTVRNNDYKEYKTILIIMFISLYIIMITIVNNLYKKSKMLEHAKTAFTNAAAHELKTPLAVIENQCECIMENVAPDKNDEYINSIYSESLRMNKLVATLLQYNRIASADKIEKKNCRLDELVILELEKYNTNFQIKDVTVETNIHKNAIIRCNSDLISLVIDNYLSNAIKHTEKGKKIKIEVLREGGGYIFSVHNEGKGILVEDGHMIFNALYKTDKSRNRNDNSTGMGLAICKEILDQHHYSYGFINKNNGVEFYFAT